MPAAEPEIPGLPLGDGPSETGRKVKKKRRKFPVISALVWLIGVAGVGAAVWLVLKSPPEEETVAERPAAQAPKKKAEAPKETPRHPESENSDLGQREFDPAAPAGSFSLATFELPTPPTPQGRLDELVFAKWKQLGIEPANVCSDAVFLRRVYLDVLGTLPTVQEARAFLSDKSPDKRKKLVDAVLERPEFAEFWAMKWSDLLRVKAEFPINLWPNAAQAYHRWIRASIRDNKSYDRFAGEMLTETGSNFRVGPVNFYRAIQNRTPEGIAGAVALTFMGSRADAWPKERLSGMAVFFSQVGYKPTREWKEEHVFWDPLHTCPAVTEETPADAGAFHSGDPSVAFHAYTSPSLAGAITRVFRRHPELFDSEMSQFIKRNGSPLSFPGLQITETTKESKAINHIKGTIIVIAGSGMCTGGRIKHHLAANISRPESTILFVGYQAVGTLGVVDPYPLLRRDAFGPCLDRLQVGGDEPGQGPALFRTLQHLAEEG